MSQKGCGFNRWMQHTRDCASRGSVADEVQTTDLLHGRPEGVDVGALAQGRVSAADCFRYCTKSLLFWSVSPKAKTVSQ